jgi:alpha-beta hydrolase superfamily lysophospholipase
MTLARATLFLLASAALVAIVVRLLEPRLAFFPFAGETTTPRDSGIAYEPLTIEAADGERLRAWLIPGTRHQAPGIGHSAPGTRHPFVVYFHGNGANLSNWTPILTGIARQGYSVLAFDYRGYGVSSGRPTEKGLYRDVDAIVDYIWTRIKPPGPVIYWGRSLGVSMAAYAATKHVPAGLILESGFPDARSLFRAPSPMALLALFSTYRFPAARFLHGSQVPVLVMHGDADTVIPYEQGRALYERIRGPKQFFTMRGADHHDATPPDEPLYWQTIRAFIEQAPGTRHHARGTQDLAPGT